MSKPDRELVIVGGVSGSGKTVALGALEDLGYYAVHNLPPKLLTAFAKTLDDSAHALAAVSFDTRRTFDHAELVAVRDGLEEHGWQLRILMLDAKDEALIRRFGETRRKHPLTETSHTLAEAISHERLRIQPLLQVGHIIDTTHLSAHNLRTWVRQWAQASGDKINLIFESFGFKYALPIDADLVFDARLLPNPHYETALAPLTGLDQPVRDFLALQPDVQTFEDDIKAFISKWLPVYERDNRASLTVAIGCTGGQHRSVYLVSRLAAHFAPHHAVLIRHRQLIA
jgi:RNase adapter protein RapZ